MGLSEDFARIDANTILRRDTHEEIALVYLNRIDQKLNVLADYLKESV